MKENKTNSWLVIDPILSYQFQAPTTATRSLFLHSDNGVHAIHLDRLMVVAFEKKGYLNGTQFIFILNIRAQYRTAKSAKTNCIHKGSKIVWGNRNFLTISFQYSKELWNLQSFTDSSFLKFHSLNETDFVVLSKCFLNILSLLEELFMQRHALWVEYTNTKYSFKIRKYWPFTTIKWKDT